MKISTKRVVVAATALVLAAGTLTACSSTSGGGTTTKSTAYKIGLLLPDNVTARYAAADRPYFTAAVKKLAPKATVLYEDADGSASKQQAQAQAMLANGVKVLVLDAFDGEAAQSIVTAAKAKHVPVIDYDRLVDGGQSNYYISFDNQKVGELQGTAFVNQLKAEGVPAWFRHPDDRRFPDGQQRNAVRQGCSLGHRHERLQGSRRVPDPRMAPGQRTVVGCFAVHQVR